MTRAVPEGWQKAANNAVFSLIKGSVIKDVADRPEKGRIPYLLIDTFNGGTPIYVPIDKSVLCSHDDPVIVMDGSRSGLVLRGKSGALGSTLAAARPIHANQLAKDFLYYYLTSLYSALNQGKTAGAVPHVDRQRLMGLPIFLPPLPEQQKIAEILGGADAAIAITRQVIEQTRTLKRALMQSLLTKGIPGRHTRFKNSPLGKIPESWKVLTIEQLLADIDTPMRSGPFGSALLKKDLVAEGIPFLGIDNIHRERFVAEYKRFVSRKKFDELSKYQVHPGDVIITIMGTVGRCCIVPKDVGLALSSKHIWTITLDHKKYVPELACWQLNYAPWVIKHFSTSGQGAIMEAISSSVLRSTLLPVPPIDEQKAIAKIMAAFNERTESNQNFLSGLAVLKSALMPSLLSGDIRVANHEQPQKMRARA